MIKNMLIKFIKLYQMVPGPWHKYCRHIPTCSNYAIQAINRYGIKDGMHLATKRILRCNPWGTYGYDPVPENYKKEK